MKPIFLLPAAVGLFAGLVAIGACTETKVVAPGTSSGVDAAVEEDGGPTEDEDTGTGSSGGTKCTQARQDTLLPIKKVSKGEVTIVSDDNGVKTIYVDASAGGNGASASNPRVYIKLTGTRVDITDADAFTSSEWDLALKRQVLWTNSGDVGPGKGAGGAVEKDFDDVTAADADAASIVAESIFDAKCELKTDQIGDPETSFTGWYDYNEATMKASAREGVTYIVKSAAGTRYKVGIVSYTGKPDGTTTAPATGFFLFKVAEL